MFNDELSEIFSEMADIEEIEGKRWESLAYRKVSGNIAALGEDIREIYRRNELRKIEGVGDAIAKKISQYINEGRITAYDEMKKKYPINFRDLRKIQGLGPKKIAILFTQLGVTNISQLSDAINSHKIAELPGFGSRSEEKLKKSLETFQQIGSNRILLSKGLREIEYIREHLLASGLFERVEAAGSSRRMRETVGDIDLLAISGNVESATDYFLSLDRIDGAVSRGESKVTVNLKIGITCDLRFIEADSFGAALQYFTGSKDHNVRLRDLAISRGMKLNEYGLFAADQKIAGASENEIYEKLGLMYIPPELREDKGEIDAALAGKIPRLIEYEEVKGDLHMHTFDSDGMASLEDMAVAAKASGLEYIAITNHSKSLMIANGLNEERFNTFNEEIERISEKLGFSILKGVELEILKDGSLDLSSPLLKKMDFVLGAMHQFVSQDREENTNRLLKAIRSGLVNSIAHPTGRLIGSRPPYQLDMDRIMEACASEGVFLEINGSPERSDLPSDLARRAAGFGVKFTLGSDAHNTNDLSNIRIATAVARRGWLTKNDIINAMNLKDLQKALRT